MGLAVLAGAAYGGRTLYTRLAAAEGGIPTTAVARGKVDTSIYATGEVIATRSAMLSAPPVGGQLRLLTLRPTGTMVKAGDVVVAFDPSDQQYTVEDQKSQLAEADLSIDKLKADIEVQAAQDEHDLLTARFNVRKGELDVKGNELLSAIEARKRELTLEEARRRLAQLEEDVQSRAKTNSASMAVLVEKRHKAQSAMEQAQRQIEQMTVTSPIDGIVSVAPNSEGQNFFFTGMSFPEYREGDNVGGGRSVAEVLDLGQLEVSAKVSEADNMRLADGQRGDIVIDATQGERLAARVKTIGGMRGARGFFGRTEGPVSKADVRLTLDRPPTSLRPGLSARITIASAPLENVLYVPRQAVFDRNGKPVVFVRKGSRFEAVDVRISTRTQAVAVVENLTEGTEVALSNPEAKPEEAAPAGADAPARMVGMP